MKNKNCYKYILVDGKRVLEHRHVAKIHHGEIPNGYVVNHKNGIKNDNNPKNLEIVASSQNIEHAWKTGLKKKPNYKLITVKYNKTTNSLEKSGRIEPMKCAKCGYSWTPRVKKPKKCPYCVNRIKYENKNGR